MVNTNRIISSTTIVVALIAIIMVVTSSSGGGQFFTFSDIVSQVPSLTSDVEFSSRTTVHRIMIFWIP